jgi:hypothetical protein
MEQMSFREDYQHTAPSKDNMTKLELVYGNNSRQARVLVQSSLPVHNSSHTTLRSHLYNYDLIPLNTWRIRRL